MYSVFYLTSTGFHFSSPTFRVKLEQAETHSQVVTNPAELPIQPSASPEVIRKKSITCIKGKTLKKVTAINPRCPTGYKLRK